MNLVVITVTHNSERQILPWASAVNDSWQHARQSKADHLRAVVVDNNSSDRTVANLERHASWVKILSLRCNVGFAAACNIGIGDAPKGSIVVLLNPDVEVCREFFTTLSNLHWPESLAAIGPQVIGRDGQLEQSARRFPSAWTGLAGRQAVITKFWPSHPVVRRELLASGRSGSRLVDWVSGACIVTREEVLRVVGGMDERYFMYWEDADWCRRASNAGFEVRYEPALIVRHRQGASAQGYPFRTVWRFHLSALRYYRAHVSRSSVETVVVGVALTLRGGWKAVVAAVRWRLTP